MKTNKNYLEFIISLKQEIIGSRYQAARLANREQLSLYLRTGQMLTQKIDAEKWGAKVIEQISTDLQKTDYLTSLAELETFLQGLFRFIFVL